MTGITRLIDERYAWPTCGAVMPPAAGVGFGGLTCTLPVGHEWDGSRFHIDPDGVQWWLGTDELRVQMDHE